jgi:DNA repair protein RecO
MPEVAEYTPDPLGSALGADLLAFGRVGYLAELVEVLLPEEDPHPFVFDQTQAAFRLLAAHKGDGALLRAFELRLLHAVGLLADLAHPGVEESEIAGYAPDEGHFVTEIGPAHVPFDENALKAARALLVAPLDQLPGFDRGTLTTVGRVFAAALRRTVGRRLRSVDFLRGLRSSQGNFSNGGA